MEHVTFGFLSLGYFTQHNKIIHILVRISQFQRFNENLAIGLSFFFKEPVDKRMTPAKYLQYKESSSRNW
jgi:hypothetical protein